MNRPIEFRGKRVDNGDWIHGLPNSYQGVLRIARELIEHPSYSDPAGSWMYDEQVIDPATLGEFSSKFDKNAIKIFENDIVSFDFPLSTGDKMTFSVKFEDAEFSLYHIKHATLGKWGSLKRAFDSDIVKNFGGIEVIGNIHES